MIYFLLIEWKSCRMEVRCKWVPQGASYVDLHTLHLSIDDAKAHEDMRPVPSMFYQFHLMKPEIGFDRPSAKFHL